MSAFLKSNNQIDKAVSDAVSFEDVREVCLSALANQGLVLRDSTDPTNIRVLKTPQPEPTPSAATDARASTACFRVVYPYGNDRYEIYGASESELDTKEEQIRRSYGK